MNEGILQDLEDRRRQAGADGEIWLASLLAKTKSNLESQQIKLSRVQKIVDEKDFYDADDLLADLREALDE